ncbi:MAG: protein kinase [Phycisphaerales bacterium]|nr:protein kinase [Phycisphaerales bacterium]
MKKHSARIRELFYSAMERDPGQWSDFLEAQCHGDRKLMDEVMALLTSHGQSQEFLEGSFYEGMNIEFVEESMSVPRSSHLKRGQRIGAYTLLTKIGEGGMADVYLAEQKNPKREVALKLVRIGVDSAEQQQRFRYESRVLGRLRHPGIAQIYESGSAETDRGDQPFFAMEYVSGPSLTKYAKREGLEMCDRLMLLAKVADAVHYAHQKGVIHRDLKPDNIVVDEIGQPKILDFGIARAVEGHDVDGGPHTATGEFFGTLAYMSPEQCTGNSAAIDVRTDVYALGVVGYELLGERMPYDWQSTPIAKQIRGILEEDPPLLGSVNGALSGEVETIIAKAMSKESARRYQSAAALADELRRYLAGDPIEAKANSKYYVLRKTIRKYRVPVAVVTVFLVLLSLSTIFITSLWFQASEQRSNAREATSLTHSILNQVIQEFEDAVRPLAGGKQVSERILTQVDLDLEKLRPLVESDAALEDVLMRLHEKQGDIAYAQGRHAEAAEHYQACLQVNQRLVEANRSSGDRSNDYRLDMARAHRKLGLVGGDAGQHFEKAVRLCELVIAQSDDSLEAKYELCRARVDFAQHFFDRGQYRSAAPLFDSVIELAQPVIESDGDDYRWTKLFTMAHLYQGRNLFELGEEESALASLNKSVELGQSLSRRQPTDTELRQVLLQTNLKLGVVHYDSDHVDRAQGVLEEAIVIGQYLTKADPSVTAWKGDLREAHHELARLFLAKKRLAQAKPHCEQAVALADDLVQVESGNPEWRRNLASSKMLHGCILVSEEEWQSAFETLEEAKAVYQALLLTDKENAELRAKLASAFDWLGKCAMRLEDSEAALDYYTQAYEMRQALHKGQPDVPKRIFDLVLSQTKLATWHRSQETIEHDKKAAGLLNKAKTLLLEARRLDKLAGHERRFKRTLSHIDTVLGRIAEDAQAQKKAGGGS